MSEFSREDIVKSASLLTENDFLRKFVAVLNPEDFRELELRWLVKVVIEYSNKYRGAPTFDILGTMLRSDDRLKPPEKELVTSFLAMLPEVKPFISEIPYYSEVFSQVIQRLSLNRNVKEIAALVNDGRIVEAELQARNYRLPKPVDLDVVYAPEDFSMLFAEDNRVYLPTGIRDLDSSIKGLAPGEEGVVVAPTGFGKSMALVTFGANALRQGYNVVHFTFENSQEETLARYVANLSGVPIDVLREDGVEGPIMASVLMKFESYGSKLAVFHKVGRHTNVDNLLADIYGAFEQHGFEPHLIVVDYGDLMSPIKRGQNRYEDMQSIFGELRDLASELKLPLWTATQTNREGAKAKQVRIDHISESFGKAMTADLILGLSRPEKDKALDNGFEGDITGDVAKFSVLKLRRGAESKYPAVLRTNFALARFDEIDYEADVDALTSGVKRKQRDH